MTEARKARRAAYQREYRKKHAERLAVDQKARSRRTYLAKRERILVRHKDWRSRNPGWLRERGWRRRGLPFPTRPEPSACELCLGPPTKAGGSKKPVLCLDHDHETGLFRGWLCSRCNRGLGLLGDTLLKLKAAVKYLEAA